MPRRRFASSSSARCDATSRARSASAVPNRKRLARRRRNRFKRVTPTATSPFNLKAETQIFDLQSSIPRSLVPERLRGIDPDGTTHGHETGEQSDDRKQNDRSTDGDRVEWRHAE